MPEINLPITQTVSISLSTEVLDWSKAIDLGDGRQQISAGTIFDGRISAEMETARKNGGKILYATTSIEQTLEDIMLNYFMGPFVHHEQRRVMFEHEVLQSSALSYRTKKELVSKIINSEGLLTGKTKSTVQQHLHTIMEWRNAFAHGKIQHDAQKGCFVRHYSGGTKTVWLSDAYWDEVEKTFRECVSFLNEATQQLQKKQRTG